MYEFRGFTQKANKALNLSIESAQNFGHDYIGTEHILLGLIKEGSGVAAAGGQAQNHDESQQHSHQFFHVFSSFYSALHIALMGKESEPSQKKSGMAGNPSLVFILS